MNIKIFQNLIYSLFISFIAIDTTIYFMLIVLKDKYNIEHNFNFGENIYKLLMNNPNNGFAYGLVLMSIPVFILGILICYRINKKLGYV